MTIKYFIIFLFSLTLAKVYGQTFTPTKIYFQVDTFGKDDNYLPTSVTHNRADSAYINFDSGFENDTMVVIVDDEIKRTKILYSDPSTGYAGSISIPKTNKTLVTIYLNGQIFESFIFDKKFTITHINYFDKKLTLTYTNKVYEYD